MSIIYKVLLLCSIFADRFFNWHFQFLRDRRLLKLYVDRFRRKHVLLGFVDRKNVWNLLNEGGCKLPLNSSKLWQWFWTQNLHEKPAQWLRYYGYLCSYNSRPFIDKDSWENHVHVGVWCALETKPL